MQGIDKMKIFRWDKLVKIRSPIGVNLEVTANCDRKCEYCSVFDEQRQTNYYQSLERFKSIIDELAKAGVFRTHLFGGEPFLHPQIVDIAEYAKASGLFVSFSSNGSHVTKERVRELIDVIDSGAISIHGFQDMHDKITGVKNSFNESINALENMLDAGMNTGISYTLTRRNFGELYTFGEWVLSNFNINCLSVNRFIPQGRGLKKRKELELNISEFNKALSMLYQLKQSHKPEVRVTNGFPCCLIEDEKTESLLTPCTAGVAFGTVDEHGNVRFCSSSPYIIGNIFETPLEEIWQNSPVLELYRSLQWLPEKCKTCDKFEKCLVGCKASKATKNKAYDSDFCLGEVNENYEES